MDSGTEQSEKYKKLSGDIFGGSASMLVALPSAIAFGLIIYAPLGKEFSGMAAIGGILGTIAVSLFAALFGGTKKLISAPCAPAAAVLSVFVTELVRTNSIPHNLIPLYILIVGFFAGVVQLLIGKIGGGRFIKYIPYPVVAGYLSGVGVLIFIGQFPKFLGINGSIKIQQAIVQTDLWRWESITVGLVTIAAMIFAPKLIKKIPAAIVALISGLLTYFIAGIFNPSLLVLENNPFVIGTINAAPSDIFNIFTHNWGSILQLDITTMGILIVPTLTLAVLLSIDTLKTCVVLDALTYSRHDSNKELFGQGLGNITSALICGIPGAGTMGATLVNLNSGARTKYSGVVLGISALLVLLILGGLVAWIPYAALAGILLVVAVRMLDKKSIALLKHSSTRFDFFCILSVVISAVSMSLLAAAGVGIAFAIILFLREQIRSSVIRRRVFGDQIFSKKIRLASEIDELQEKGKETIIVELQGQLFFGTADQLFSELDPYLKTSKYVLLDMKRVQSVDYTAVNMLKQIHARIKKTGGNLVFSSIPLNLPTGQNAKSYLHDLGLTETENLKFFNDLDGALTWIEDDVLKTGDTEDSDSIVPLQLNEFEFFDGLPVEALETLQKCMTAKSYTPGEKVFEIGEESDEIYFIRKGMIKILLPLAQGIEHHLITFPTGGLFGDMSFLDKGVRSALAIAVNNTELYVISRADFESVKSQHPEIGSIFFERLAKTIANRVRQNNIELKALQET